MKSLGLSCEGRPVGPEDSMPLFPPSFFFEVEPFLEIVHYGLFRGFDVSITLWVNGACGLNLDLPFVAEFFEYLGDKPWPDFGYYFVRQTMPAYNVFPNEVRHPIGGDLVVCLSFDTLGKLIC